MAKHKLKIYKIKIMINTKELRLGNLFANIEDDSIYKVTKINEDTIEGICINNMGWIGEQHFHLIEQVLPIKLTEEWLLKFGFDIEWLLSDSKCYYVLINNKKIRIKFVHSLQNLFFSLCGEELTQVSEGKK